MKTTLADILAARDKRAATQRSLMADFPQATLLCATVVMPGAEKQSERSGVVAHAMTDALQELFANTAVHSLSKDLPTGYELYMLVKASAKEAKILSSQIEETHPLGRLFDIDVIKPDGIPMSRSEIGLQPRTCLLCSNNARICMRQKTHSAEEIDSKINRLINEYLHRNRD